ncbi:unnamed protein product [Phytophthora lilii]|uniref:Unnamed protein product n=1 Tax=Phytophthora lilii TaxID=2077276 RepID=A0A9W6WVH6_9STRA|nr:unnamed protein product [Phytophthora lilii]
MDVKTAFLNDFLDENIYMMQPEGFAVRGKEHLVCKLLKSLNGLKQAPRIWYITLCTFLMTMNFYKLIKDQSVFVGIVNGTTCYIMVYVDDLLVIAPTVPVINKIKDALKQRFKMSDLGKVHYILGWSIVRNRADRTIFIHQEKKIRWIASLISTRIRFERPQILVSNPVRPCAPTLKTTSMR